MHPLVGALLKIPASRRIFQTRFTRIRLEDASRLPKINNREAKPILRSLSLPGVTHLDLSSSPATSTTTTKPPHIAPSIVRLWTHILPCLADLDLSYNVVGTATLADIARNGHALTTLRVVGGMVASSSVTLIDVAESESLRCLYLEDCRIAATRREEDDVFLDPDQPTACPFSHVLPNLERISLRGCRYYDMKMEKEHASLTSSSPPLDPANHHSCVVRGKPFTQLSLIKIVRGAQNLTWFQSDLSEENVAMLKEERPDVTFVR